MNPIPHWDRLNLKGRAVLLACLCLPSLALAILARVFDPASSLVLLGVKYVQPSASGLLGLVHRLVRVTQQNIGARVVVREHHDAGTGGGQYHFTVNRIGLRKVL